MLSCVNASSLVLRFLGNASRQYPELFTPNGTHGTQDYTRLTPRLSADAFLQQELEKYIKPGDLILEIGCNRGNNLIPLSKKYAAYGLDLQAPLLKELQEKARVSHLQFNPQTAVWDFAENGTLPPEWEHLQGKLKAIYAVQVVSHLTTKSLQDAFKNLCKHYLAPGGVVILTNTEPMDCNRRGRDLNRGSICHTAAEIRDSFPGLRVKKRSRYQNEDHHFDTIISDPNRLESVLSRTYWWVLQKPDKRLPAIRRLFDRLFKASDS